MPLRERGPIKAIPADIRALQRWLRDQVSVTPDPDSVGPAEIVDAGVTEPKIAPDAVTAGKIAANAVTTGKIPDGAVTDAKLRDSAAASVIGRSAATSGDPADIAFDADGKLLVRRLGLLTADLLVDADIPAGIARDTEVTAAITALNLASGVYTPTLTNVANLDASTAFQCQYLRVGSVVTVSGKVSLDPTLTTTTTQLGISLPIASNIGAAEDCAGVAFAPGIAAQGAAILGDLTNDRAQLEYKSTDITNQPMYFSFTYRII